MVQRLSELRKETTMKRILTFGLLLEMVLVPLVRYGYAGAERKETGRNITFNESTLTPEQQKRLESVERLYGTRLPDNRYWYDNRSGLMGVWNGPAVAVLPPGLGLGGVMPANCSRGGTRVFINGRELHPIDVARLAQLGTVVPGRFWLDPNGDFGIENGPALGNLVALASAGTPGNGPHRTYEPGELSGVQIAPGVGACTNSGCVWTGQ
jgi:hypothetical protein